MYSVASCELETSHRSNDDILVRAAQHQSRAEWELLLACAAPPDAEIEARRTRALASKELNWPALVRLAESHGVMSLVCERLRERSDEIPDHLIETLVRASEQNARHALWLTQLLFTVTDLLQERGIPALPYKGPVLAELLYGSVTRREYSDVDIIVGWQDVPKAKLTLQQCGFSPALHFTPAQEKAHVASGYEYTFHSAGAPNVLELQWRVLPRFYAINFDMDAFFARAQTLSVAGKKISTLGNEDLLLVLCAHAAKHAWSKLSWIREVAELGRIGNLDWDRVLGEAERLGIRRIVGVTFQIARKLLGGKMPSEVEMLITRDSDVEQISHEICFVMRSGGELSVASMAYFRVMARVRERLCDRLRFGLQLATTPSTGEWSIVRLPGPMFPLYGVLRAGRVAKRLLRGK